MDGGRIAAEHGGSAAVGTLGDDLAALLDQLARAGLKIGPREHIAATALAASVTTARGEADGAAGTRVTLADLVPLLAPLLARSRDERETYDRIVAAFVPDLPRPAPEPSAVPALIDLPEPTQSRPWVWWVSIAVAVLVLALVALVMAQRLFAPEQQKPEAPISTPTPSARVPDRAEPAPSAPARVENKTLDRITTAAEQFEGAPTLEELAPGLAATSPIGWTADAYLIRLHELTGLPTATPLGLYLSDGDILARLAHALDRIERPGQEGTLEAVRAGAGAKAKAVAPVASYVGKTGSFTAALLAQLAVNTSSHSPYDVAVRLGGVTAWPADWPTDKAGAIARIQRHLHQLRTGRDEAPTGPDLVDPHTIERGLAITPPPVGHIFADPPWRSKQPPTGQTAPWWLPWLVLAIPVVVAAVWLTNSLTLRKAYLRRRPPELPPLLVDLVVEAAGQVRYPIDLYRRIARRLQVRSARPTGHIDPVATVAATLRGGGELIVPVYAVARHTPEYLVLIERRATGDQDARRLRDLVARLHPLVPMTIFYFQGEASVLEPEEDGRPVTIQRLQTLYPEHRLLILGAGTELLDPVTFAPQPAAVTLRHWTHRALLTPLPLAEWGREEIALADGLALPIGRATPDGLLALAELIGRERTDGEDLVSTSGDGLARPLPEVFRVRPQRFLYSAPPADTPVPEVLRHLRNLLDGPSFDWLAALAVYPAVQWDLTLHLGITLPDDARAPLPERGSSAPRLYREDRIAALTQLPWLREGFMPAWLRRALIAELSPERAAGIRAALQTVLNAAQLSGDPVRDEAVKLRIAREPAKEDRPPAELLDDEVLVDFLARGRIEDLAVPPGSVLERIVPKSWLDRLGLPELVSGGVALAYGLAGFALAPPAGEALVTGAWLPLVVLTLGALVAFAVGFPREAYVWVRTALIRLGPFGLTLVLCVPASFVLAGKLALVNPLLAGVGGGLPPFGGVAAILVLIAQIFGWAIWRYVFRMRSSDGAPRAVRWAFSLASFAVALTTLLALTSLAATPPAFADAVRLIASIGTAVAATALLTAWLTPVALRPPRPAPRTHRRLWGTLAGAATAAVALLPILPAVWIAREVTAASVKLAAVPPGPAVIAHSRDGRHVAIGGVDGIVHVYALDPNGGIAPKPIARIPASPTGGYGAVAERPATGAVMSLDIRAVADRAAESPSDSTDGPVLLAVGTADGKVRLYDARGGATAAVPPTMAEAVSAAAPPLMALGAGARPLAAFETADGGVRLVSAAGETSLTDSGIATALIAADADRFVLATQDGRVRLVAAAEGAPPRVIDDTATPRLASRARRLTYDPRLGRLTATAEDGARLLATVAAAGLTAPTLEPPRSELALGTGVGWMNDRLIRAALADSGPLAVSARGTKRGLSAQSPARSDWDVVPVYFGTNRKAEANPKRASYTADREDRLELGQALVTVPRAHKVGNIERPLDYRVPFTEISLAVEPQDPAKHFTLREVKALTEAEGLAFIAERLDASSSYGKHALVYVHSFGTTFDHALYRTAQIASDLEFDGAPFVYSWPSLGQIGQTAYNYDRESAEVARPHFRRFLEFVAERTGAERVSIIAHGMGHQVLMPVLEDVKRDKPAGLNIAEVILAAPDMERLAFENIARGLKDLSRGLTLYASANDVALKASRQYWGGAVRAGDVPQGGPIVVPGMDTIDVSNTSTDWFGLNHSLYAETMELITDIKTLLRSSPRQSPSERNSTLQRVEVASGIYWRMPQRR